MQNILGDARTFLGTCLVWVISGAIFTLRVPLLGPQEEVGKLQFCLPSLIPLVILIELYLNGPLYSSVGTLSRPRGLSIPGKNFKTTLASSHS